MKERVDDINGSLKVSVIELLYSNIVVKEVPDDREKSKRTTYDWGPVHQNWGSRCKQRLVKLKMCVHDPFC